MKKTPFLCVLILGIMTFTNQTAKATDYLSPFVSALSGAGGYLLGKQFEDQWSGAPILGAALAPLIVDFGYNIFKDKQEQERLDYYISGRNYERWIMTQKSWYQSTLDPYTGRPPAFSGLHEMDAGLPRDYGKELDEANIADTITVPVKVPAGVYNGVPRTERIVPFPKLP